MLQETGSFITKYYFGNQYSHKYIESVSYWLTVKQLMCNHVVLLYQDMRFLLPFPKLANLRYWIEFSLGVWKQQKKLCSLYSPSKPNRSLSPVTMVKSHEKKCQFFFRVNTSWLTTIWWNVAEMSILKDWYWAFNRMTNFDYCDEYLRSISNKILLWQSK